MIVLLHRSGVAILHDKIKGDGRDFQIYVLVSDWSQIQVTFCMGLLAGGGGWLPDGTDCIGRAAILVSKGCAGPDMPLNMGWLGGGGCGRMP